MRILALHLDSSFAQIELYFDQRVLLQLKLHPVQWWKQHHSNNQGVGVQGVNGDDFQALALKSPAEPNAWLSEILRAL